MAETPVPRPTPKTPHRVVAFNRRVTEDWNVLVRTRRGPCIECWDHIAHTPTELRGGRYAPLKGEQAWVDFQGQRLRQWQWEIDKTARVKVGVGREFVVIMRVSFGHPREYE
jgi:hypothetical protein